MRKNRDEEIGRFNIAIYDSETGEIHETRSGRNLQRLMRGDLKEGTEWGFFDEPLDASRHRINMETGEPELIPVLEREMRDFIEPPMRRLAWKDTLLLDLESAKTIADMKSVVRNLIDRLK